MVSGLISPGGGDTQRDSSDSSAAAAAHVLAATVAGAATVSIAWFFGGLLRAAMPLEARVGLVGVAFVWAIAIDAGVVRMPGGQGQVPQGWWSRHGPVKSYLLYGLALGTGVGTKVNYAFTYAALVGLALLVPLAVAALAGGLYGFARSGTSVLALAAPRRGIKCLYLGRFAPRAWAGVSVAASLAGLTGLGVILVSL